MSAKQLCMLLEVLHASAMFGCTREKNFYAMARRWGAGNALNHALGSCAPHAFKKVPMD